MNLSEDKRVCVVIPAFNEQDSIGIVIDNVKPSALPIVVDDGSIDKTSRTAESHGAFVIRHQKNLGYDAALRTGIRAAIDLQYDFAISIDADGQHDTNLLNSFINELSEGAYLVVGLRDNYQRFSELVFAKLGSKIWGIEDPLCGMKGYSIKSIESIGFFDSLNSIGTECAIRISLDGGKVVNIPMRTKKRTDDSRFGSGLLPNLKILKALWCVLLLTFKIKLRNYFSKLI